MTLPCVAAADGEQAVATAAASTTDRAEARLRAKRAAQRLRVKRLARTTERICAGDRPNACRRSRARLRRARRELRAVTAQTTNRQAAPILTASGRTLTWKRVADVDRYVLASRVDGESTTTYRTVTGLRTTPPVAPGKTVSYGLRTDVPGSAWAREAQISYPAAVAAPDPASAPALGMPSFAGGFEASPWTSTFKPSGFNRQSNVSTVGAPTALDGTSLSVKYPRGSYSTASVGSGGTEFRSKFDSTGINIGARDTVHLRYMIKFAPNFQFNKGGKLPGLCGGTCIGGGNLPTGHDGWSGRLMWTSGGAVNFYMYHSKMAGPWGTYIKWNVNGTQPKFAPGKWHCVEMAYKMNTPGQANGELNAWFDDQPAVTLNNFRYRETTALKVDQLWFNTFFGGSTSDWASPQDQHSHFDNIAIASQRIGCATGR